MSELDEVRIELGSIRAELERWMKSHNALLKRAAATSLTLLALRKAAADFTQAYHKGEFPEELCTPTADEAMDTMVGRIVEALALSDEDAPYSELSNIGQLAVDWFAACAKGRSEPLPPPPNSVTTYEALATAARSFLDKQGAK